MSRIIKLDELTHGKIAAGEVVEKPASIVKELFENSVDSGATQITVEIENGGIDLIRIIDNGSGIDLRDIDLVFERHCTSKINSIHDLMEIKTLGFRGEALASISAVSKVRLITRTETGKAHKLVIAGGKTLESGPTAATKGSIMEVSNLFFNTPVRLKFLRTASAERREITNLMQTLAIAYPKIRVNYIADGQSQFTTDGSGLDSAIYTIYGRNLKNKLMSIDYSKEGIRVQGFSSVISTFRGNRKHQMVFVNNRVVKSELVNDAIAAAYKPYLPKNSHAICFLFIELCGEEVDVNIHPSKIDIKFINPEKVYATVLISLKTAINLYFQLPEAEVVEHEEKLLVGHELELESIIAKEDTEPLQQSFELEILCEDTQLRVEKEIFDYLSITYIGRFGSNYLLFARNQDLFIMDKNAAHQRIIYNDYLSIDGVPQSQYLITPFVFGVESTVDFKSEDFTKYGFVSERFGPNDIILRAIPIGMPESVAKSAFAQIVDNSSLYVDKADFEQRDAMIKAFTNAVNSADTLAEIEVEALISKLAVVGEFTSPSGRPIIVEITGNYIDRLFRK